MKTKTILITVILLSVLSCKNKTDVSGQVAMELHNKRVKGMFLPGKMVVEPPNSEINKYVILNRGKLTSTFSLPLDNKERRYSGIIWLNNRDLFLAVEGIRTCEDYNCYLGKWIKSNLVLLDTTGKIVEKVYEFEEREEVYLYYPSPNDSLLLFFTDILPITKDPKEDLMNKLTIKATLNIMDLKTKKIIKKVENFATFLQMDINESPWSADGSQFVYGINNDRKVRVEGQDASETDDSQNGIYIYDLKTDERILISKKGKFVKWAPGGKYISYEDGYEKLVLYNTIDKTTSVIFNSFINYYMWAPDGKYLFVIGRNNDWTVRVSDKKISNVGKIIINWANITWKK